METPDAQFLVLDLYVRNNDRTASTLPPLKLVDAQGREFDESGKGTLVPGVFEALKKLNPGVSSRGYVVFDVPHGQYTLLVSGGFESGEHALIDLSAPTSNDSASGQQGSGPAETTAMPAPQAAGDYAALPTQTESAPPANTSAEASRATTPDSGVAQPDPEQSLQFESGARLYIDLTYISHQPDGSFTFLGRLLLPVALAGGGSVDQGAKVMGTGTASTDHPGHATVTVKGVTVGERKYTLQAESSGQPGTGPGIESASGKTRSLEVWFSSASIYQKAN
jgi:hypothetical protein